MTMIKKLAVLSAATAAFAATPAMAQDATADGTARVQIVQPMTLTADADLFFGSLILGDLSGGAETIVLNDTDAVTCSTNVTCIGTPTSAQFTIDATGEAGVTVTIPNSVVIANTADATETITVTLDASNLVTDLSATETVNASNTDYAFAMPAGASAGAIASQSFTFGGELDVDSTTVDGYYDGTFTVDANYQ